MTKEKPPTIEERAMQTLGLKRLTGGILWSEREDCRCPDGVFEYYVRSRTENAELRINEAALRSALGSTQLQLRQESEFLHNAKAELVRYKEAVETLDYISCGRSVDIRTSADWCCVSFIRDGQVVNVSDTNLLTTLSSIQKGEPKP